MQHFNANRRQVLAGLAVASTVPAFSVAQAETPNMGGTLKIGHSTVLPP